ncbi:ABC transporter ATP-binding protein [Oecophyllibacter saccharovorans]|uniref:ATP-binding cassette domain-containing protein n=1 Tax=Oecophyllibacter saccharovorans TaxID=2558360 RepID=A0A506UKQ0_9PROT|nr:ATP-binding cassette domain-containing protein [Oecophyllibacter saccharovorans]TPW33927.1 ATP-binding cassette domain-containing protein [Oecophyllibacter saccharovorans]
MTIAVPQETEKAPPDIAAPAPGHEPVAGTSPAQAQKGTVPRIRIRGLCKTFGNHVVLDGVDLDVWPGESLVVIGGSGTGKSVLLRCILGLLTPDEGSIEIDGVDILTAPAEEREKCLQQIGMLFQNAALFDSMSVLDNILFGLRAKAPQTRKLPLPRQRQEALELLAQVGLGASVGELMPAELSGGMQKRVGLARSLAGRPSIQLFDEPTTGLDPIMSSVINRLIVDCVKRLGATAITITHDMESAQVIGTRAAMLYEGRIIWSGPADRLMDSGNPVVEQFTHGWLKGPIKIDYPLPLSS